MANHRSRLGQRQLSVAKQNGEKFKTTTTQCVGIFQETEDPIKVTEVRGGCVQVDVGDHDNLMGLYAQSLGE